MKSKEQIEKKIEELRQDERLSYKTATIDENAPLALMQVHLKALISALMWALNDDEEGEE